MADLDRDLLDKEVVELTPVVRRVIKARVADPDTAEELVQETLTRLLEARPRLSNDRLAGYAIVTARNLVNSFVASETRAQRYSQRLVDYREPEQPEEELLRSEEREAIAGALGRLSLGNRRVLVEHEVLEKDVSTIAKEIHSTPGAVAARLARARGKLRLEYLLALRRTKPPTDKCRLVLAAVSMADRRRQEALGVDEHLAECSYCADLSKPLLRRRRGLAALLPAAGLGELGNWLKTPKGQFATAAVAAGTAAALYLSYPGCPNSRIPIDDGPFPIPSVSDLGCYSGKTVETQQVTVASVPSNEGFWIRSKEHERIWIQMLITGESPVQVVTGQRLGLTGKVLPNPPNPDERFGLSPGEGAEELQRAGYHIEVKLGEIRIR